MHPAHPGIAEVREQGKGRMEVGIRMLEEWLEVREQGKRRMEVGIVAHTRSVCIPENWIASYLFCALLTEIPDRTSIAMENNPSGTCWWAPAENIHAA